jgi:glycosyltransferase involved in cell wall biosynthesis
MRFCMVTTFYPPYNFGGDGIFVHRLSNALAKRGHRIDVIHCIDAYFASGGKSKREKTEGDHPNITVHSMKSPFGLLSPLSTQQTGHPFFKSARILEVLASGFDVIHYHNISLVGGPKILQYGNGVKLYSMHEYWLVCPTHVLFKFKKEPCTSRSCILCGLRYGRPPQWWRYSRLMDSSIKHVDAFIAPDFFTIRKHHEMGFDAPIVCLPHFQRSNNGTDSFSGVLEPGELPSDPYLDPYFLFVGRLEKLKGLQTIIPLFSQYRKARLLVAGTGDYENKLRRLAGKSENIRFLGYVSGMRLDRLYQGALGVIVPSINYEVSPPLVILEAFRQRAPVLVRNLGSMPELVEESGGGCVFNSEQELLTAMEGLVDDPALRQNLGLRGYQASHSLRSEESYIARYLRLIDDLRKRKEDTTPDGVRDERNPRS